MFLNKAIIPWVDILGSAMRGRKTHFAETYRTNYDRDQSIGLQPMMGCED